MFVDSLKRWQCFFFILKRWKRIPVIVYIGILFHHSTNLRTIKRKLRTTLKTFNSVIKDLIMNDINVSETSERTMRGFKNRPLKI